MDSANQLGLWQEPLPEVIPRELAFFVPLPFCVAFRRAAPAFAVLVQMFPGWDLVQGPEDQMESFAHAGRRGFCELEQLWVSLPISFVPRILSLVRPMLSRGHPTRFAAG